MKLISKIILGVSAFSMLAVSCVKEEVYTPGAPDASDCYGVYFPTQKIASTFEPSESDYVIDSILVSRTVDTDLITVPVVIEGTAKDYVTLDPVTFEDGQKETYVKCTVSKDIPQNEEFAVSINVVDTSYVSKYSTKPTYLSFKVVVESWNLIGEGKFWDLWLEDEPFPANFYVNGSDSSRFRVTGGYDNFWTKWGAAYQKGGWVLTDYAKKIEFRVLKVGEILFEGEDGYETEITREGLVYYDSFKIGLNHPSYGADIYRYHPSSFKSLCGDDANFQYNKVDNWQENGLPSVVYLSSYVYMPGIGGWGGYESTDEAVVLQFPGGVFVDYSLSVETGSSVDGQLPISFETGKDVEKVLYAVYEGELTSKDIRTKKAIIAAKEEPAAQELDLQTKAISFSADTTSLFTIIAVAFDKNGKEQENTNAVFGYVKAGDEKKVEIVAGASLTQPNEAYQAVGYSPITSLTFNVYGKDLKSVSLNCFAKAVFEEDTADVCWSKVKAVSEEVLTQINKPGGYTGVIEKLNPLTDYVLLVSYFNGYKEVKDTCYCTTDGLPLEFVCSGIYSTEALFETEDSAYLYLDPNITKYKAYQLTTVFGDIKFGVTPNDSITIAPQTPGYSHASYGTLYYGEVLEMMKYMYPTNYNTAIAYYENQGMDITSIAGKSKYESETQTYKFAVCWYLTAGYIRTGIDTYVVDQETKKLVRKSRSNIKFVKALKPEKEFTFSNIIWNAPQLGKTIKPASYKVTPIEKPSKKGIKFLPKTIKY